MTLLELLVKELPKRGGWPELAKETIEMHDDGEIFFDGESLDNFDLPHCSDGWRVGSGKYSYDNSRDNGFWSNEVTRDQYEAAIDASQQPVWSGEGLPPVGVECDGLYDSDDDQWLKVIIIAHDGDRVIGRWLQGLGEGTLFDYVGNWSFRPIRTEAERKREDAEATMRACLIGSGAGITPLAAKVIYDAISAGKIAGVKLDN